LAFCVAPICNSALTNRFLSGQRRNHEAKKNPGERDLLAWGRHVKLHYASAINDGPRQPLFLWDEMTAAKLDKSIVRMAEVFSVEEDETFRY
jgi:hypothetical protein